MKKKILFVIHKMGYGGAPKIMAFLANRLSLDDEFYVYLLTYEDTALQQELAPKVHHINPSHPPSSIFAVRRIYQIIQVRNAINIVQPDVLIAFLPYPNIISILASIGTRVAVIISHRGDPFAVRSWFTRFRDIVYGFADGYIFQTNGEKNYYSKKIQIKSTIIPNPVVADGIPSRWLGRREDRVVHVGRFMLGNKRQDLLINAFSRIANKYPNIKLVMYGDGEDESAIRGIIAKCSLEDRVDLPGFRKNIYEEIRKARLFVLSSDNEGMPNALIEAMCVGLPCLSTDCSPGGAAELIKHMENGILVKAGCEEELAQAMDFMLANPETAETMGQNALKIRKELDPDVIVGRWREYIDHQIARKASKRQEK